jgi:exopolyphosphatase / guanosine-5'-triphosphate,3'-diphosphate pyrophosphatase
VKGWSPRALGGVARDRDERRAVIDIGSNTVRLVVYGGPPRAPAVLWNEKVSARLGRDLARTGEIPEAAMDEALAALARYRLILKHLGVDQVETVATAAPRDAANGSAFLERAARLGLKVRLLSGEDEARASAYGAIGAFPEAAGMVADLGGGSLELVEIADGVCGTGHSLPLGTLRLPDLRAKPGFARRVGKMLAGLDLASAATRPLFMIGGTWRALAVYAMRAIDHPLTDPHGFRLAASEAEALAKIVQRTPPARLATVRGVSAMRAEKLPDAAALLRVLLSRLEPEGLVFSSWGLREGLNYCRLGPEARRTDPFLAGVAAFAGSGGAGVADPAVLAEWVAAVAPEADAVGARMRLAGARLALALHGVEPNLRPTQALEWALDKRWIGIGAEERAVLAAILTASLGQVSLSERASRLAPAALLDQARATGLALRLAHRLGAGSAAPVAASRLATEDGALRLIVPEALRALIGPAVGKDLAALAAALALRPEIVVEPAPAQSAVAGAASGKKGMRTSIGSPSSVRKV